MHKDIEVYPPENKNMVGPNEKMVDVISKKIDELSQNDLHISGMMVNICQIPAHDNGHTAIIKAGLQTNTGIYEALGTASPKNIQDSEDTEILINKASVNAFSSAATLATIAHHIQQANVDPFLVNNTNHDNSRYHSYKNTNNNKKQFNHSPNKAASEKQIQLIRRRCNECEISEDKAREMAGVRTSGKLSSQDAHAIITALNRHDPNIY